MTNSKRPTHTVHVAGYEAVLFYEGPTAATDYAKWARKLGYTTMIERQER